MGIGTTPGKVLTTARDCRCMHSIEREAREEGRPMKRLDIRPVVAVLMPTVDKRPRVAWGGSP